jgi:molybdate transport system permease protein
MLGAEEWEIVRLSLKVSLVAVGASLPLAFALAWLLARGRFPGRCCSMRSSICRSSCRRWSRAGCCSLRSDRNGPIGAGFERWFGLVFMFRWTGAALAAAIMALPLMVRAMRLSIEAVDRRLEGAARTLGATRWHVFRTITLPLSLPGVLAGAVLGFARSIGEFGATITFVSNIPGETRDAAARHLFRAAGPGRRGRW